MGTYTGSCHCGGVRFELDPGPADGGPYFRCNCSLCLRKGAVMGDAPRSGLRITHGQDLLTLYQWNTGEAEHWFCRRCGIYTHHVMRGDTGTVGFNVACVDALADAALAPVEMGDGRRWSRLRQATRADIPGFWEVRYAVRENTLRRGVISDEDCRREIEDTGRGWVVEQQGRLLAFAIGNAQTGNVWALFVHPDAERQGHGRRLHDTMVGWLWSQGLQRLWLNTGPDTRARTFYERAGWQAAGLTAQGEMRFELPRPAA